MLFYFSCLAQQIFIVPYRSAVTGASEFIDTTAFFSRRRRREISRDRHLFSL